MLALRWLLAIPASPQDAAAGLAGDWHQAPWTSAAVLLYIIYSALTFILVTMLALLWARGIRSRWTAIGLRLVAASGVLFGLYLLHKTFFLVAALLFTRPGYDQVSAEYWILLVAVQFLVVGLAMPLVATGIPAAVRLARQRRAYGRLRPLWLALTAHRPDVVMSCHPSWLPKAGVTAWDVLDLRELAFRLYRRVIECWDVIAGLHGHLDADLRAQVLAQARLEHDDDTAQAIAAAVMIRVALDHASRGEVTVPENRRADSPDNFRDLSRYVLWWQRVAQVWGSPTTARLSPQLTA
ncbi:hypothetical protein AFB00_30605 (plasmid) [Pseudonocardia sp. HH130630-07]|nr:MAB_1171c family putative transporter [Pseudonocardia sp. HH130630-07]ANY10754.1 hypothetical protein AFB00_30605 [Pseudonocardia sp. HH130630-07]